MLKAGYHKYQISNTFVKTVHFERSFLFIVISEKKDRLVAELDEIIKSISDKVYVNDSIPSL